MLVVSRKENESIRIEPLDGIDPSITLRDLFAGGPIVVTLTHVGSRRARLAIDAPHLLKILRSGRPAQPHTAEAGADLDRTAPHAARSDEALSR